MIVLPRCHYLCQVEQFEILRLKVELWPHQIIPVPFVGLRELHLIYLVLDHQLAREDVVEGADVRVVRREGTRSLDQIVFFIVVVLVGTLRG